MTVRGNLIEAPTRVLGLSKDEANARAVELLDLVGLGEKIDEHPARLSGGQQQRVAIARALAMRPDVLLLDEVTSALDPELTGEVLRVIEDLAEGGMTMIMVTHEMGFARRIADQLLFMHRGRVWETGPGTILAEPRTTELRQFVGSVL
jgi:polar amino acid transport system ATP-binding protein